MLREYETIYILRPDISDTDADRVTERVKTAIRSGDGRILEVRNWGKRRLAYEIAHNQKGIYIYWRYAGNNKCVAECERVLRMLEPVVRYITVRLSDEIKPEAAQDIGDEAIPMRVSLARADEAPADGTTGDDRAGRLPEVELPSTWDEESDDDWEEEPYKRSDK